MDKPIVECIANFSEGRRYWVIEAIAQAITSVKDVFILDRHADQDHNRCVISFIGAPDEIEKAAFLGISKASELINLNEHTGEHPRIGAADVVPFVPISGVTMQDCVEIAHQLGKRVGEELNIPVYFYEEAALVPDRRNLEDIRRGEYESLKAEIGLKPERLPDHGPKQVGPAGAVVIGARHPLIAFNVYLNTEDIRAAKKIARAIRHSSGGLRYVKALGMKVDGQAQVSMNLTNYKGTPVSQAVEMVRSEAARLGYSITKSELVGLIPQDALTDTAVWHLQLDNFDKQQILEQRINHIFNKFPSEGQYPDQDFLNALASSKPTPGGGSASAYTGAQAAALTAMVARLTVGREKYTAVESEMEEIIKQADELLSAFRIAVIQDAEAYSQVMTAYQLPKDTPDSKLQRQTAIQQAFKNAIYIPLHVSQLSIEVLQLISVVVAKGNINAIIDGGVASSLASAAIECARMNIQVNSNAIPFDDDIQKVMDQLNSIEEKNVLLDKSIRATIEERSGIKI